MTLPVYNQKGEEVDKVELDPGVFGIKTKPWIIQQAVVSQQANARQNIAHTKDRGEVRGGGRKPWRQKGTGRARHGSIRSPIWRGGGVTFGPKNTRNFSKKINKKIKRQALLMSLSEKTKGETIKILEKLELAKIKTKQIVEIIKNLKITEQKIILVLDKYDDKVIKSARNLAQLKFIAANSLNAIDIVRADVVLTTISGIKKIEKTYGSDKQN
jgi:large subunit ribosomal protein L4